MRSHSVATADSAEREVSGHAPARPGPATPPSIDLCGIRITRLTAEEFDAHLRDHTTGPTRTPLVVASVNLDHVYHFGRRSGLRIAIDHHPDLHWLLLADGAPISRRATRLTGTPWPRVTGADVLPAVLAAAAEQSLRVGFLGGTVETARVLADTLPQRWPGLQISGFWNPPRADVMDHARSRAIAARIAAAETDLLVVGLGKPRQERWIAAHGEATGAQTLLAFGAAADFLAGSARRAPAWMRHSGCEWLFRLACEPRRLSRRYLIQGPVALYDLLTDRPPRTATRRAVISSGRRIRSRGPWRRSRGPSPRS